MDFDKNESTIICGNLLTCIHFMGLELKIDGLVFTSIKIGGYLSLIQTYGTYAGD